MPIDLIVGETVNFLFCRKVIENKTDYSFVYSTVNIVLKKQKKPTNGSVGKVHIGLYSTRCLSLIIGHDIVPIGCD